MSKEHMRTGWERVRRGVGQAPLGRIVLGLAIGAGASGVVMANNTERDRDAKRGAAFDRLLADPAALDLYHCSYTAERNANGTTTLHLTTSSLDGYNQPVSTDYDSFFTDRNVRSPFGMPMRVDVVTKGDQEAAVPTTDLQHAKSEYTDEATGFTFTNWTDTANAVVAGDPTAVTAVPFISGVIYKNGALTDNFNLLVACDKL